MYPLRMKLSRVARVIRTIIVIGGIIFLIQQYRANRDTTMSAIETIQLVTEDQQQITADLYSVAKPKSWFILLHMMPAAKESWKSLAQVLQEVGYESIAIDFRGHGQSSGGPE